MIYHIHFLKEGPELRAVAHIPSCEMDIWAQCFWIPRREVIQTAHLVSFSIKLVGKRRAEESRGSGNEEVHAWIGL
jgi:hypothetical protein